MEGEGDGDLVSSYLGPQPAINRVQRKSSGRPGVLLAWRSEGEGEGNPEHDLNGRSECAWNCLGDAYCVVGW